MGAERLFCIKRLRVLAVAVGAVATMHATPAAAKEKTATVEVFLNVVSTCRVQTDRLDFGFPVKGAKSAQASTVITLQCTPGVNYRVGIDNGDHFDGTERRMWGGQANGQVWYVPYRIYRDAARVVPWGNTPTNSAVGVMPLTGTVTLPVYGSADLKNVRASEYRDTVTVVLEY